MKLIKQLLRFNRFRHYDLESLLIIARNEFRTFDDFNLKYKFLEKVYSEKCPYISTEVSQRVNVLLEDEVFETMPCLYSPSFYLRYKIKDQVDSGNVKVLSPEEFEQIARREFVKFDDDILKFRFLSAYFRAQKSEDEVAADNAAQCLVESGSYEYADLQNIWYGGYDENIN